MKNRSQIATRSLVTFALTVAVAGCSTSPPRPSVASIAPLPKPAPAPVAISTAAPAAAATEAPPPAPVADEPQRPLEPFTIPDDQGRPINVYPPTTDASRAPLVVMLHATCMKPAAVCDWFGSAGRGTGWLICPSGNGTCAGEPDWEGSGRTKAAFLERAIERVEERVGTFVDEQQPGGVLIGWSRGAFAARDMVVARRDLVGKHFTGLVLIAAQVAPDAATLHAAGIRRIVMAAGDYDLSRPMMVGAIDALHRAGMPARFVSLGRIGHVWPANFETTMREPIAWAGETDD